MTHIRLRSAQAHNYVCVIALAAGIGLLASLANATTFMWSGRVGGSGGGQLLTLDTCLALGPGVKS